jgi:hypothetical protein
MSATGRESRTERSSGLLALMVWLVSLCLLGALLAFILQLFSSNVDFPPTWYWAISVLLGVVDVAAMCYIGFRIVSWLLRKIAPRRAVQATIFVVLLLGASHAATIYAYSRIPQWDFQSSLFDDLSWPGPGKISQDCRAGQGQNTSAEANGPTSVVSGEQWPISLQEVVQIAQIQNWQTRNAELESRTAAGWYGWVHDVERHGYYSNPDHHLVSLFLHDPYSGTAEVSQLPEAVVSYFDAEGIGRLTVGQEVLVCGNIAIDNAASNVNNLRVSISRPVLNPLPLPEALASVQIPSDFSLGYEVHGCGDGYKCPDYDLQIDAQGSITYRGNSDVQQLSETYTVQVPQDKIKQLVFELQRTNLFAMTDIPDSVEGKLDGATIIRARMDGKDKTVVLPWSGPAWPARIAMLIGKVEEVSDLQRWVTLVMSP